MGGEEKVDEAYRNFRIYLENHNKKMAIDSEYAKEYRKMMRGLDWYVWKNKNWSRVLMLLEILMGKK